MGINALPNYLYIMGAILFLLGGNKMIPHFFKFFSSLFFIPIIILISCLCFFLPVLSMYSDNIKLENYPVSNLESFFIDHSTSRFLWPAPRIYNYNF